VPPFADWISQIDPNFDPLRFELAASMFTTPMVSDVAWTQAEWNAYFRDFEFDLQFSQKILFGGGSDIAEGQEVMPTLRLIRDYVHHDIFSNPIVQSL
jgi:hypothetical protein